jgi:hypothetical protein
MLPFGYWGLWGFGMPSESETVPKLNKCDAWFAAQFGKRPGGRLTFAQLVKTWCSAQASYVKAKDAMDDRAEWDNWRDVVLKAWQARESEALRAARKIAAHFCSSHFIGAEDELTALIIRERQAAVAEDRAKVGGGAMEAARKFVKRWEDSDLDVECEVNALAFLLTRWERPLQERVVWLEKLLGEAQKAVMWVSGPSHPLALEISAALAAGEPTGEKETEDA